MWDGREAKRAAKFLRAAEKRSREYSFFWTSWDSSIFCRWSRSIQEKILSFGIAGESWQIFSQHLEHFRKRCRPEFHCYPTLSAEKNGKDGARRSTAKTKML